MTDLQAQDGRPSELEKLDDPVVLEPLVKKAADEAATRAVQLLAYRGPMPLPDHMEHYERIFPGSARIIVEEFQANGAHSREMEKRGQMGMIQKDQCAQHISAALVVACLGFAIWAASAGHEGLAIAAVSVLGVAVITGFLTGAVKIPGKSPSKEEEE